MSATLIDHASRPLTLRLPWAYGYLRIPKDVPDEQIMRAERAMERFAGISELYFVSFFYDFRPGSHEGFNELMAELRRADACRVVVPSLRHFSTHPLFQDLMVHRLESDAAARVLVSPTAACYEV